MEFSGRVYFDPTSPAVWRFYRFLTVAAGQGARLRLAWRAFATGDEVGRRVLAGYEAARTFATERHGAYLQALLVLAHREGADLGDPETIRTAATAAGIDPDLVGDPERYLDLVDASTSEGRALGVRTVPSIYRHGPVLEVDVTPAAFEGDALARLRLIDGVLEDDGIWRLGKP